MLHLLWSAEMPADQARIEVIIMHTAENFKLKNRSTVARALRVCIAASLSGLLLAGCASHNTSSLTVAQATAVADGTEVVVTGAIVQQVDREHLLLSDGSGQINVTIDDEILGKVKFAPDSRVRVLGKIDRNSERSVLIAKSLQVVQ
jgi:uncharacterized protein (TIGR00156 family)